MRYLIVSAVPVLKPSCLSLVNFFNSYSTFVNSESKSGMFLVRFMFLFLLFYLMSYILTVMFRILVLILGLQLTHLSILVCICQSFLIPESLRKNFYAEAEFFDICGKQRAFTVMKAFTVKDRLEHQSLVFEKHTIRPGCQNFKNSYHTKNFIYRKSSPRTPGLL